MAVNVLPPSYDVVDSEDAPAFLDQPLTVCPEEPYESRECVLVEDLAPILNRVLETRIKEAGQINTYQDVEFVGIRAQLCEESGVPERRLFGILNGEGAVVTLDIADRLLLAAERSIHDLTIYNYQEARNAVLEQTQILRTLAKSVGFYIPPGTAKAEIPRARRAWPKRGE